jgi:hypothetical protein
MPSLNDIADFVEKTWYDKKGLVIALLVATPTVIALFPVGNIAYAVGVCLLINTLLILIWLRTQAIPKSPKDKLGFLVCLSCTNDSEAKKIREDFIVPLRQLVKSGQTGNTFHFIELPQYLACKVEDIDDAQEVRIKARAHFMIYGRVRLREINKKMVHVLEMQSIVAHQPITDKNTQLAFAREFSELMPSRLHVEVENDALSFQFSSAWTDIVAKYVISLAAALSGDDAYAERLLLDAKATLHGQNTKFPIYSQLKQRIPLRISSIYQTRAKVAYKNWDTTRDLNYLREAEGHLAKLAPQHMAVPSTHSLLAIISFCLYRNPKKAFEHIKAMKDSNSAIWLLNMAFLHGYMGQLTSAIRHYRLAITKELDMPVIAEVENFIEWALEQYPDKFELFYCLGFFNWKLKGDCIQADKDFTSFLAEAQNSYQKEQALALKWREEIRQSPEYILKP